MISIILSLQLKSTIQKHSGDLEAAESACAELHMEIEEEPSTGHSSTTSTTRKRGGGGGGRTLTYWRLCRRGWLS